MKGGPATHREPAGEGGKKKARRSPGRAEAWAR